MNPRRLIPYRLRHSSRVTAIQCRLCGQWRKPRHIRIPAMVCRDCETTTAFQQWKPTHTVASAAMAGHSTGGTR
jgi:hypothetical protein